MKMAERVEARSQSFADTGVEGKAGEDMDLFEDEPDLQHEFDEDFIESKGLTSAEAANLLALHGKNMLPEKIIPKWYIFVEQLWQPMPLMIWAAVIIELAIGNFLDMGILLGIQFGNASIGYYEISKAGDAVAALKKSLQAKAYVKRDGAFKEIAAEDVVPGDLCLLAIGAAIPADCRTNEGQIEVDQAALTGESLPVTMYKHDECKMGSTVVRGETEATVVATGANTFFGKTAALLENTGELSNMQKLLISIMLVLVVISIFFCLIVFVYLLTAGKQTFKDALAFTVILLVASIPLAMEVVTTTTLAIGSKQLSNHGAIVSRLAAIEDMAGMGILCSDKTGTLTLNTMVIQQETPTYVEGENQASLLRCAAMAAKWLEPPKDALDTLTLNAVDLASLENMEQLAYMPFDPVVKRTEGTVKDTTTGKVYKTTKGAPHVLLKLVLESGPNDAVVEAVERDVHRFGLRGIRSMAVARTNDDGKWEFLGLLTFLDPPRPDTKQTIEDSISYGVQVKMITGDHLLIAKETGRQLGMGDFMCSAEGLPILDMKTKKKPENLSRDYGDQCLAADGFAQVFPEHKYLIVECLRELGYKVGMTGDGVNDAPALKRADVGVAVQGATDAARAAADIVLTEPGLSTIVHGIVISRCIFVRIRNFLIYRIAATLQLLFFFFIAVFLFKPDAYRPPVVFNVNTSCFVAGANDGTYIASFPAQFPDVYCPGQVERPWPAFFHMPVIMLMMITLLNDGTLIAIGYDNAIPSQVPEKWNKKALFLISSLLAGVALVSSLLLLFLMLDSWNKGSLFDSLGLGGVSYGQITTAVYLKVSISDFLTLFAARTGGDWFWKARPANMLIGAGIFALTTSTLLATFFPESFLDKVFAIGLGLKDKSTPTYLTALVWGYCIVWWFIQDASKVLLVTLMEKYNWCGVNDTGKVVFPQSTLDYIKDNKERIMAQDSKGGH